MQCDFSVNPDWVAAVATFFSAGGAIAAAYVAFTTWELSKKEQERKIKSTKANFGSLIYLIFIRLNNYNKFLSKLEGDYKNNIIEYFKIDISNSSYKLSNIDLIYLADSEVRYLNAFDAHLSNISMLLNNVYHEELMVDIMDYIKESLELAAKISGHMNPDNPSASEEALLKMLEVE